MDCCSLSSAGKNMLNRMALSSHDANGSKIASHAKVSMGAKSSAGQADATDQVTVHHAKARNTLLGFR